MQKLYEKFFNWITQYAEDRPATIAALEEIDTLLEEVDELREEVVEFKEQQQIDLDWIAQAKERAGYAQTVEFDDMFTDLVASHKELKELKNASN